MGKLILDPCSLFPSVGRKILLIPGTWAATMLLHVPRHCPEGSKQDFGPEHSLCTGVSVPKIKQAVLTFKVFKHSFHSYVFQAIYGENWVLN